MHTLGQRWRDRWRAVDPGVRAMVAVLLLLKVAEVGISRPTTYPDTPTYRRKGSFLDFSLTSLDGHSVRPWGVTVWMALWPSDKAMIVAQAMLSFVAWTALAFAVAATIRRSAMRRALVAVLLLIPCTAQVAGWDLIILGESVSVSTAALAMAALVHLMSGPSWRRAGLFLLAALWFTMTRPNVFVLLCAWAVAVALIAVFSRRVVLLGAVAAVLVLFSAYSYAYNIRSDVAWAAQLGYSRTTVAYGYPISSNGPVADYILRDLRHSDAPRCMIPPAPHVVSDRGTTRWVRNTVKVCPEMDAWATRKWNRWYASWLLHHPGMTWKIIRVELPNSLSPPVWSGVTAAVPDSVSSLFFGSSGIPQAARPDLTYRTQPLLLWLAASVVLGGAIGLRRRRARGPAQEAEAPDAVAPRWPIDAVLAATVAGGLASAITSGLLIQTAPFEVGQESMGALVVLTVSSIVLVALGLDRVLAPELDELRAEEPPADQKPERLTRT